MVAWQIARGKKAHCIGESIIKPAALDMVRCRPMCGEEAVRKLAQISLSNNTIQRRIVDISTSISQQLLGSIKLGGSFSLQLDESTDRPTGDQVYIDNLLFDF